MIGLSPAHLSSHLSGTKSVTTDILDRILSGLRYKCTVTILLHPMTGQAVQDVDFTPLEEMLSSEDQDTYSIEI